VGQPPSRSIVQTSAAIQHRAAKDVLDETPRVSQRIPRELNEDGRQRLRTIGAPAVNGNNRNDPKRTLAPPAFGSASPAYCEISNSAGPDGCSGVRALRRKRANSGGLYHAVLPPNQSASDGVGGLTRLSQ
jgi:hypothetical protein